MRYLLCALALIVGCFSAQSALAQTQWWLYGIGPGNTLVRVDPSTFARTVIGSISTGTPSQLTFRGIEYDSVFNRVLVTDTKGVLYSLNQNTALATQIDSTLNGFRVGGVVDSLAINPVAPFNLLVSVGNADGSLYGIGAPRNATTGNLISPLQFYGQFSGGLYAFAWRVSPPGLFGIFNQGPFEIGVQQIDQSNGDLIGNNRLFGQTPFETQSIVGMAFNPLTHQLFANNVEGVIMTVGSAANFAGPVIVRSVANVAGPNNDLAFLPVTPTPTITATSTPTTTFTPLSTPTPTPTSSPTVLACPSGFVTSCGCDKVAVLLANGQIECGPVDTVTKTTTLQAPRVIVSRKSVALVFRKFTAVSDGKTFRIIASTSRVPAREEGEILVADIPDLERAGVTRSSNLSVRYEVQVTPRGSARANQRVAITSKRNRVTVSKLSPGTYTARYRVNILKGTRRVGTTKFSPAARFTIRK